MTDSYEEHCHGECRSVVDDETGEVLDDGIDCAHCECCCSCLGCEYGPGDGMQLTAEQRAPIAALAAEYDDVAPNAGSAS